MRRVLFAIVFLFQYVSGVVVRSGVAETLNGTLIVPTEKSLINSASLDKSNKIDEKEIFENGDDKANNLSERSFVWINTRFKSPLRTKIYNSKIDEWKLDSLYQFKKTHNIAIPLPQRQYPPPPKSTIFLSVRQLPSPPSHQSYLSPPTYQNHPNSPSPPSLPSPLNPTIALFRPHHNIGVPCAMSEKHLNKKTSNKCNHGFSKPYVYQKFHQEVPKMVQNLHSIVNNVLPDRIPKPHNPGEKPKNSHSLNTMTHSKVKETYGFPSLYQVHRSAFNNEDLSYKLDEMNLEGNVFTDNNFVLSPVDGSDEDKLLERYIKHTLANTGVRILNNLHSKCKECNEGKSSADCKCETNTPQKKSKLYQFIEKNTEQLDIESTTESKNKMNEYDDSSNDETFSNKTMVDVLFMPNTINDLIH